MPKICKAESCSYSVYGGGYCQYHQHLRTDGKAPKPLRQTPFKEKPYTWSTKPKEKKSITGIRVKESMDNEFMGKADSVFSQYVRISHIDEWGRVQCFTCGVMHDWKEVDCGHFIPRGNKTTRYELDNCRPQCTTCNRVYHGREEQFRLNLVREIGIERVNTLIKWEKKPPFKLSHNFFQSKYEEYSEKLKEVKKLKGIE